MHSSIHSLIHLFIRRTRRIGSATWGRSTRLSISTTNGGPPDMRLVTIWFFYIIVQGCINFPTPWYSSPSPFFNSWCSLQNIRSFPSFLFYRPLLLCYSPIRFLHLLIQDENWKEFIHSWIMSFNIFHFLSMPPFLHSNIDSGWQLLFIYAIFLDLCSKHSHFIY